jgi:hypothetical protein
LSVSVHLPQGHRYLGDPEAVAAAARKVENQGKA